MPVKITHVILYRKNMGQRYMFFRKYTNQKISLGGNAFLFLCFRNLVYGVNDDGTMFSITKEQSDNIVKTLGNIAFNNLSQSIQIQHNTIMYSENALLFISLNKRKSLFI